ncbi:DNA polymerase epsilon p12 subunit [Cryptococcus deuterogattii 99/473]|uniref:DNA polymerase epsilon p12 subunit n=2 Tax=Cryptococcus deuterogattii TaxID=1859096 RepID=A0A0D0T7W9_9TREE|nr:DNA polymerase epsilon p12 subunit [Cryptococcus deuterogattii R265]KIR27705.1 DNA polymerase epsilon p12 subunit [Cryptococcus deuterogattii LA55]KIR31681.1 DNA polymerase epsilon p12 subunit [Cryptococcus deuterogattii MMRL2647]KIR42047.1 DNA polymerase epsilon p12 subunit [Cryptococcus deuterogattii Ram5]KIR73129.1 DNA polymerase epsilon p12 subunit [Cryptococcus deuterogattii CA1014]KIR90094.1 DNA polymerase epsilon p12 subunit [Cryptococcus deuterogattii CBS 10090]KIR98884.1 DNA polym
MQVEYESSPAVEQPSFEEGVSFRPGSSTQAGGVESEEEQDEEDVEAGQGSGAKKPARKRIIKQRQSLAEKQPGTTMFPVTRVKKIVKADRDIDIMSSEAVFMVSVAAEYFIKHFMEEGYTKARLEKRKLINYRDMANVVARSEEFDFLKDVIPTPMPLSEAIEKRKRKVAAEENLDEDAPASSHLNDEDLPPLVPSTNPAFPNAIVKKPSNTHAKGASAKVKSDAPASEKDESRSVAPNAQGTRKSARRSTMGAEDDADKSYLSELRGEGGDEEAITSDGDEKMDEE